MRFESRRVSALVGLAAITVVGCSDDAGPMNDGSAGSTAGTSAVEAGSGGTGSDAAGAGGAGVPTCGGDASELTIDGTYWMWAECNDARIQGAWYCYTDGLSENDCSGKPQHTEDGYCLSGTTLEDASGDAWGAAVAFELNHPVGGDKASYDATARGVTGFALDVVGNSGGASLRVGFKAPAKSGVLPFVEFGALEDQPRTLIASIAEASVPSGWDVPNAGEVADPRSISDVELRIAGGDREASYSLCVVRVTPLFD
jgi:hypothetical protein